MKYIFLLTLFLTMSVNASGANVPGSYAVTIKGEQGGNLHFSKLAMYSFRPDGTIREDFWIWYNNSSTSYVKSNTTVGYVHQPSYPYNIDDSKKIIAMQNFLSTQPISLFGTWTQGSDPNEITINWSFGDTETWRMTWEDENLNKIELVSASYLVGGYYLDENGVRNVNATNAGWGFGAAGVGFNTAVSNTTLLSKNYSGGLLRYNAWNNTKEPMSFSELNLSSALLQTNIDSGRLVQWDNDELSWVFSYINAIGGPGLTARRVIYQTSHDFNHNGHIEDDPGHTYAGIQIIDAESQVRGVVFSDSSAAAPNGHTISSMYFIDETDCEAHIGVNPDQVGEC